MITQITSTQNERYKHFKALKQKKERTLSMEYTVEGIKSVQAAISAGVCIISFVVSTDFYNNTAFEYPNNADIYVISDKLFPALSTTDTPSGIIAVIKIEETSIEFSLKKPYIYCDNVRDPGNLGTIIRTADAAGFAGVLLSPDCAEIYNPKVVRSSMGSFFQLPIIEAFDYDKLKTLKMQGFNIFAGILTDDTIEYTDADMTKPMILAVGNEANGISDELIEMTDVKVKIPIIGNAESLNVAIASAILMYECLRQRKKESV